MCVCVCVSASASRACQTNVPEDPDMVSVAPSVIRKEVEKFGKSAAPIYSEIA